MGLILLNLIHSTAVTVWMPLFQTCERKIWCLWHCGLWNKPGLLVIADMIYCDPPILPQQRSQQTLITSTCWLQINHTNKSQTWNYICFIYRKKNEEKLLSFNIILVWVAEFWRYLPDIGLLLSIMKVDVAAFVFAPNYASYARRKQETISGVFPSWALIINKCWIRVPLRIASNPAQCSPVGLSHQQGSILVPEHDFEPAGTFRPKVNLVGSSKSWISAKTKKYSVFPCKPWQYQRAGHILSYI